MGEAIQSLWSDLSKFSKGLAVISGIIISIGIILSAGVKLNNIRENSIDNRISFILEKNQVMTEESLEEIKDILSEIKSAVIENSEFRKEDMVYTIKKQREKLDKKEYDDIKDIDIEKCLVYFERLGNLSPDLKSDYEKIYGYYNNKDSYIN